MISSRRAASPRAARIISMRMAAQNTATAEWKAGLGRTNPARMRTRRMAVKCHAQGIDGGFCGIPYAALTLNISPQFPHFVLEFI